MKVKSDFVTNSSSCSYIIYSEASFILNDIKEVIYKRAEDVTTLDMIKMIEGELQYDEYYKNIKQPLKIQYKQEVEDFFGDGWDGGDYYPFGKGWRFIGNSKILQKIMNKENEIIFDDDKIIFPFDWVLECDPESDLQKKIRFDLGFEE